MSVSFDGEFDSPDRDWRDDTSDTAEKGVALSTLYEKFLAAQTYAVNNEQMVVLFLFVRTENASFAFDICADDDAFYRTLQDLSLDQLRGAETAYAMDRRDTFSSDTAQSWKISTWEDFACKKLVPRILAHNSPQHFESVHDFTALLLYYGCPRLTDGIIQSLLSYLEHQAYTAAEKQSVAHNLLIPLCSAGEFTISHRAAERMLWNWRPLAIDGQPLSVIDQTREVNRREAVGTFQSLTGYPFRIQGIASYDDLSQVTLKSTDIHSAWLAYIAAAKGKQPAHVRDILQAIRESNLGWDIRLQAARALSEELHDLPREKAPWYREDADNDPRIDPLLSIRHPPNEASMLADVRADDARTEMNLLLSKILDRRLIGSLFFLDLEERNILIVIHPHDTLADVRTQLSHYDAEDLSQCDVRTSISGTHTFVRNGDNNLMEYTPANMLFFCHPPESFSSFAQLRNAQFDLFGEADTDIFDTYLEWAIGVRLDDATATNVIGPMVNMGEAPELARKAYQVLIAHQFERVIEDWYDHAVFERRHHHARFLDLTKEHPQEITTVDALHAIVAKTQRQATLAALRRSFRDELRGTFPAFAEPTIVEQPTIQPNDVFVHFIGALPSPLPTYTIAILRALAPRSDVIGRLAAEKIVELGLIDPRFGE